MNSACLTSLLLLASLCSGCGGSEQEPPPAPAPRSNAPRGLYRPVSAAGALAQRAVEGVAQLHREWNATADSARSDPPLSYGAEIAAASDPNRYFEVLDQLSLEAGYSLECLYQEDSSGGYPVLHAQKEGTEPFESVEQLTRTLAPENTEILESLASWASGLADPIEHPGHPWQEWIDHVQVTDTAGGFLQLGVLRIMADQFALSWHANYERLNPLCHPVAMEIELATWVRGNVVRNGPDPQRAKAFEAALRLDLNPRVAKHQDTIEVSLIVFMNFGGFIRRTMYFSREFPHSLVSEEAETLVDYNWGVNF